MSITFSSCFYIIKSKFDSSIYIEWMNNFISIVNNFNLVIYTDENSCKYINTNNNSKIKIVIKPIEQFYNYKYKDLWVENHEQNFLLNDKSCWELNMLWSEKIWFVKETIERKYFDTDFYGWCDIGYFRNRSVDYLDTHTYILSSWPNEDKIKKLNKEKIVYACINNDDGYMNYMYKIVNNKNTQGIPVQPIPPHQQSIAGGFFILKRELIDIYTKLYLKKLVYYFTNNFIIKDDQTIINDIIFTNPDLFYTHTEDNKEFDNWFMFQRLLL